MKYVLWIAFGVMALLQWFVPAKMILDREAILAIGKEFRFKTAPVDPHDPFRGKFITLRFEANEFPVNPLNNKAYEEEVFVHLTTDPEGYAAIAAISPDRPNEQVPYVKARVGGKITTDEGEKMWIAYPFDRFYMEESMAYAAEQAYLEALQDSSRVTYAVVSVKEGEAVVRDVMIDGISVREIVKAEKNK